MKKLSVFLIILILSFPLLTFLPKVYATEIFSDGFESGDFSAWDSTEGSPTIQTTEPHCGTYSMFVDTYGEANNMTKKGFSLDEGYVRGYFYITLEDADSSRYTPLMGFGRGYQNNAHVLYYGDNYAGLSYYNGSRQYVKSSTVLSLNSWHCIELYFLKGDGSGGGVAKIYVNGSELEDVTQTDIDNDDGDWSSELRVGSSDVANWYNKNMEFYADCIVVDDEYIGPEAEEGQNVIVDLPETCIISDSLTTQKSLYRVSSESITVSSETATTKTLIRAAGESLSITTIIETEKEIHAVFAELFETIAISASLETVKHIAATLFELSELTNVNTVLNVILPTIPLTAETVLGICFVLIIAVLGICLGLIYQKRRKE